MTSPTKRVAIVTGAAQGIGRGIAQRLAKDGFDLGLFDLPGCTEILEELASGLRVEFGTKVITVYGDVSLESDVKGLIDTVVRNLGDLYAMVANAGTARSYELHETPTDVVDKLLSVNIKGTFFCYKYAAMQLIKQGKGGRMIGASSLGGKAGHPGHAVYCATKFAIRGLTQSAAMDYGKHGITVNTYAPGAVDTPLISQIDEDFCARSGLPKGSYRNAALEGSSALGRAAQPADIANVVSFLLSDDASFITGQSLSVDGGMRFD
ncbi:acetoin reductase family protein [Polyporus arcularius HHB13444]|uniref:Acetoin reductase family protein n=1 Tax=Polyporus arcularius HHB13444 TaxID=1314778 RepID=A0A5C3NUP4_9APHY|nr:acetoin reductase family protein [Polyporus arcularius HHB13444]